MAIFALIATMFCGAVFAIHPDDRLSLEALYSSTNGASWDVTWDLNSDLCGQFGVTCDINERVTQLNLRSNGLSGTLPTEIALMTLLSFLNVGRNNIISGNLPTEIGLMTSLLILNLSYNAFSGNFPTEIGSLTALTSLDVNRNSFSGPLPTEITLMTLLNSLYFSSNSLRGNLPTDIGLMTELLILDLSYNFLSGNLLTEIGLLTALTTLNVEVNSLSGNIPTEIGLLASLLTLELGLNSLSGSIPTELGLLTSLTGLSLFFSLLTGNLPTEIGLMTSLLNLELSTNQLSGSIPTQFGNLGALLLLNLHYNQLSGSIPTQLGNLGNLQDLSLYSNQLSGTIPTQLANLESLRTLLLVSNNFSCPLPRIPDTVTTIDDFLNCSAYGVWKTSFLRCEFNGTRLGAIVFCSDDRNHTIADSNCESFPKPNLVTECVGDWRVSDWSPCIDSSQSRTAECISKDDCSTMNETTCLSSRPKLEQNCNSNTSGLSRDMIIAIGVSATVICLVVTVLCYKFNKYKNLQQKKNIIQFKDLSKLVRLSEGNFGIVYSAFWESPKGTINVVCKTPKLDPSKNDWLESMILNKVKPHENILSLCGICLDFKEPLSENEGICIVVPFYSEGSLDNFLLHNDRPLSHEERCSLALGMAKGLQHLHNSGFLHRDVAARNYLLNSDLKNTILSDFGLSRPISEDGEYKFVGSHELPAVNAPETLSDCISTRKSDIWQLGVAFWWLHASGRTRDLTPFSKIEHHSFLSTLKSRRNSSVPLEFFDSSEFVTIIKKCCAYYPNDRPKTEHIILELTALLEDPEYNSKLYVVENADDTDDIAQHLSDSYGSTGNSSVLMFDAYQSSAPGRTPPNPNPDTGPTSSAGYELAAPGNSSAMAVDAYGLSAPGGALPNPNTGPRKGSTVMAHRNSDSSSESEMTMQPLIAVV